MKKAILSSSVDLTNGGCNACGTVESVSYRLELNGREITMDGLTVSSVVMTIVLAEGWQQEFKMGMMDDYTLYSKDGKEVRLDEEYDAVTYQGAKQVNMPNRISDFEKLFEQVNRVLEDAFEIEPYEFVLEGN